MVILTEISMTRCIVTTFRDEGAEILSPRIPASLGPGEVATLGKFFSIQGAGKAAKFTLVPHVNLDARCLRYECSALRIVLLIRR